MANPSTDKLFVDDSSEDDDGPITFKRPCRSSSNKNQLNAEIKKPSPLLQSQNSVGKNLHPWQGSFSDSSSLIPHVKHPVESSQPLRVAASSSDQHSNHASRGKINSIKHDESSDDDDKPLISRLKGTSNISEEGGSLPISVRHENSIDDDYDDDEDDDDDDDVPLSSRKTWSKENGSSDQMPSISKVLQNGSVPEDKKQLKSSIMPAKRPICKAESVYTPAKRPKLSASSTVVKVKQVTVKKEEKEDNEDITISQRMKKPDSVIDKSKIPSQKLKPVSSSFKKSTKSDVKQSKPSKYSKSSGVQPNATDGQKKWTTLEHCGVIFPPPYTPHGIKMLYQGKPIDLTPEEEEVATMFAVMKETDYVQKPQFLENYWNDWRVILGKKHIIQRLDYCDFTPIHEWHLAQKEKKKQMSTEEKKAIKEEKMKLEEKYMWAVVDGVKEKVGNFRVEPPGLFRGRGEHPKMGKLKRRIKPSDITINIGKGASIPECPIPGESWKEVKHDNTVTWLAFWNDPINVKEFKYVFLAASSSLKGQSDKEKYEKARQLKDFIERIRAAYTKDFMNKDIVKQQIAVATYLIDKLALRAGNEKDDDEADTVGCCTLKVSNVECIPSNTLKFDFLGKDSIRYENAVEVEPRVYTAIGMFQKGKQPSDNLFDQLDTNKLNAHLKGFMNGLTAKVFRTFNASITLDEMLYLGTDESDVPQKLAVYQGANKQVAIICNHQRTISKSHGAQMSKLIEKIDELKYALKSLRADLDRARKGKPLLQDADGKQKRNLSPQALEKKIAMTNQKIEKMELSMKFKEDLKSVALGTSKINYLDPRITVAWCKRHDVPIEKIFNKSLLAKFAWAMDVEPDFKF